MTTAIAPVSTAVLPAPGVYPSVPFEAYQRWPAASNSGLSKLMKSPAHLRAYLDEPQEDTAALLVGRAVHTAILEPDDFASRFTVAQLCNAVKKDGAQCTNTGSVLTHDYGWRCGIHAKGMESDVSAVVLSADDYETCLRVRDSVHAHPAARFLLDGATQRELSAVWKCTSLLEREDVDIKARLDVHSPNIAGGAIVDVKSTRDASRSAFEKSIFSYGYHRQGALYLDGARAVGLDAEHFVFIAVEKEAPYAVAVYRLTEDAITAGRDQLNPLLRRYAECVNRNEWPAYSDKVQDIALPTWAWQHINDDLPTFGTDYEGEG